MCLAGSAAARPLWGVWGSACPEGRCSPWSVSVLRLPPHCTTLCARSPVSSLARPAPHSHRESCRHHKAKAWLKVTAATGPMFGFFYSGARPAFW